MNGESAIAPAGGVIGQPRLRGHLHTWAAAIAVPAGALLIVTANRSSARIGAAIYAASLLALFATSASYHRLARSTRARRLMRRLDHSMIFVLIAGTYTPVCLLALPRRWGIPILSVVWTGAVVGVVLKTTAFDRYKRLQYMLYPALGWTALAAMPVLFQEHGRKPGQLLGKSPWLQSVHAQGDARLIGRIVDVHIAAAHSVSLSGEIVTSGPASSAARPVEAAA